MNRHQQDHHRHGEESIFATEDAVELYTQRMQEPSLFPQERRAFDRYFTKSGASVLDIGCGAGRVASILDARGFEVTGIDTSRPLVERARELCPRIEFRVADVRNTGFDSRSFEYAVFSWFGIDYLTSKSDRIAAFREIYRLLKPGGIFVFSTHNSWHPVVPLSIRDLGMGVKDLYHMYVRRQNRQPSRSHVRTERVPLGDVDIYLANPVHHWLLLRKCGFTPLDVIGERDGVTRFFERDPHFVAKK